MLRRGAAESMFGVGDGVTVQQRLHHESQLPGQVLHLDAMSPTNYPDKYYTEIRTSAQVLLMYVASPNYPDKYYTDIRTSTTFGRHESQLPGQVLHGCRVPVCRVPVYVITNSEYN